MRSVVMLAMKLRHFIMISWLLYVFINTAVMSYRDTFLRENNRCNAARQGLPEEQSGRVSEELH